MVKNTTAFSLILAVIIGVLVLGIGAARMFGDELPNIEFNQERAYQDVITQVNFGPRVPGSQAHAFTIQWIEDSLISAGWSAEVQELTYAGQEIKNVIGKINAADEQDRPWIILMAHYDSRQTADHDPVPENRSRPVPGANDGASGVAVLLEMARSLSQDIPLEVWLLFVDAEDQGDTPGWDWILGSRAFVDNLTAFPDKVVLLDMIGDKDLQIFIEKNSFVPLREEIWSVASELGFSHIFINEPKYSLIDDHIPFLMAGIPAIDIIDFDYPYYHTTADTADKVSPESLGVIGNVLLTWLEKQQP